MLPLLLATSNFLFSCQDASQVVRNIYHNQHLTSEDQKGLIESVLEVTPPECDAHYYNE